VSGKFHLLEAENLLTPWWLERCSNACTLSFTGGLDNYKNISIFMIVLFSAAGKCQKMSE
jgi:hypothetical protein